MYESFSKMNTALLEQGLKLEKAQHPECGKTDFSEKVYFVAEANFSTLCSLKLSIGTVCGFVTLSYTANSYRLITSF